MTVIHPIIKLMAILHLAQVAYVSSSSSLKLSPHQVNVVRFIKGACS